MDCCTFLVEFYRGYCHPTNRTGLCWACVYTLRRMFSSSASQKVIAGGTKAREKRRKAGAWNWSLRSECRAHRRKAKAEAKQQKQVEHVGGGKLSDYISYWRG